MPARPNVVLQNRVAPVVSQCPHFSQQHHAVLQTIPEVVVTNSVYGSSFDLYLLRGLTYGTLSDLRACPCAGRDTCVSSCGICPTPDQSHEWNSPHPSSRKAVSWLHLSAGFAGTSLRKVPKRMPSLSGGSSLFQRWRVISPSALTVPAIPPAQIAAGKVQTGTGPLGLPHPQNTGREITVPISININHAKMSSLTASGRIPMQTVHDSYNYKRFLKTEEHSAPAWTNDQPPHGLPYPRRTIERSASESRSRRLLKMARAERALRLQ